MVERSSTKPIGAVIGVVLAGGRSSRMGEDKAQLVFCGKPLIAHQYEKLVTVVGRENAFVSGSYPAFQSIVDECAGVGPLGGISTVLRKFSSASYFLFLPVDMPKISTGALRQLLKEAENDRLNNCWTYRDFEMPLLLRNHKKLAARISEVLAQRRSLRSVRHLCSCLQYRTLEVRDADAVEFVNTNTLEQWKAVVDDCTHECQ